MKGCNTMKAKYIHDCELCTFLGTITYLAALSDKTAPLRNADLYHCFDSLGRTVIARFSYKGSTYASCPPSIARHSYAVALEYSTGMPALITSYIFAQAT